MCTFVTPDVLETVAKSPAVSHHVQKAAARTLEIDNSFRGKRATAPEKDVRPLPYTFPALKVIVF